MDEQIQQQAIQYIMAIMQGGEQAMQQVGQAAQQGDQAAQAALQLLQAAQQGDQQAQQMLQQIQQQATQSAKHGAKLNYIKYLRGQCPNGYKMQTFRKGGAICKKCVKKKAEGGNVSNSGNVVNDFRKVREQKCGGKSRKFKK